MLSHLICACTVIAAYSDSVGKTNVTTSRHHPSSQTRNVTDEQHEKIWYEQSRVTDEDKKLFSVCQTAAAEVCICAVKIQCFQYRLSAVFSDLATPPALFFLAVLALFLSSGVLLPFHCYNLTSSASSPRSLLSHIYQSSYT